MDLGDPSRAGVSLMASGLGSFEAMAARKALANRLISPFCHEPLRRLWAAAPAAQAGHNQVLA